MLSNIAETSRLTGMDEAATLGRGQPMGVMTIAFVNNMGATGFDAAERQFERLVALGAEGAPYRFQRFLLHDALQLEGRSRRVDKPYSPLERISASRVDGVIVTGAEPRCENLRDEPYWPRLTELLDWAESLKIPVLLSCLAAHAAVLHWDDIPRRRLPVKRSGVFLHQVVCDHPLVRGVVAPPVPHSRWNDLDASALAACGYSIMTSAADGAVDTFVRQRRNLIMGFQGHPEYEPETLLLEYRRDVRRFLTGAAAQYPELPIGYFSPEEVRRLEGFRALCCADPAAALATTFPVDVSRRPFAAPWHSDAARLLGNWLSYVREHAR